MEVLRNFGEEDVKNYTHSRISNCFDELSYHSNNEVVDESEYRAMIRLHLFLSRVTISNIFSTVDVVSQLRNNYKLTKVFVPCFRPLFGYIKPTAKFAIKFLSKSSAFGLVADLDSAGDETEKNTQRMG